MSALISNSSSSINTLTKNPSCCCGLVSPTLEAEQVDTQLTFNHRLPCEISRLIFSEVLLNSENSPQTKQFFLLREVSKSWCLQTDKTMLSFCWNLLKETTLPQLKIQIDQISQKSTTFTEKNSSADLWTRFILLSQILEKQGAHIPINRPILGIMPAQYEQTKKRLDDSIQILWDKIREDFDFDGADEPTSQEEIRNWLNNNNPKNADLILQLTRLDLSGLELTNLVPEIGRFDKLESLELWGNRLTSIPNAIGNLTQLKHLLIEDNELESIPETIGNLVQLEYLELGANRLESLPETIGNLTHLKTLCIEDNRLASLPETIGNMAQLERFDLRNNKLKSLPETIRNLPHLNNLVLEGNPLSTESSGFCTIF